MKMTIFFGKLLPIDYKMDQTLSFLHYIVLLYPPEPYKSVLHQPDITVWKIN